MTDYTRAELITVCSTLLLLPKPLPSAVVVSKAVEILTEIGKTRPLPNQAYTDKAPEFVPAVKAKGGKSK